LHGRPAWHQLKLLPGIVEQAPSGGRGLASHLTIRVQPSSSADCARAALAARARRVFGGAMT
jgi:hypothetical protein